MIFDRLIASYQSKLEIQTFTCERHSRLVRAIELSHRDRGRRSVMRQWSIGDWVTRVSTSGCCFELENRISRFDALASFDENALEARSWNLSQYFRSRVSETIQISTINVMFSVSFSVSSAVLNRVRKSTLRWS